jgi:hypothetical protein
VTYPNDPNRRPDILRKRDPGMSGPLIGGLAVALVLFLGVAIYLLGSGNRDVAGTDSPRLEQNAPSTTGQGRTNTMPGRDQNVPNPTPPVPPVTKQPQ